MKRHIIIKVLGEEIVNVFIEEQDDEETVDESENEESAGLTSSVIEVGPRSVGFTTPWSDVWWDDED